jgi:uncharacterized protein
MNKRHFLFAALALLPLPLLAQADKTKKLALQVSDNDPVKMNAALNIAVNVSKEYADKGMEVDIQIVVFNAGLHMLRDDTSPVKERVSNFKASMKNVSFKACNNTIQAMSKMEGKAVTVLSVSDIVPAGVTTLMDLSEKGYVIVRP